MKVLLSFGADINARNKCNQTPLDIAIQRKYMELVDLLFSAGGSTAEVQKNFGKLPRLMSFHDSVEPKQTPVPDVVEVRELSESETKKSDSVDGEPDSESREKVATNQSCQSVKLIEIEEGDSVFNLYERIQHIINMRMEFSGSFSANTDEAVAITLQQRELLKYKRTEQRPGTYKIRGGSRILCLDGGGMRGLIHLEVLRQLEEQTGRRITEMFDWIVGTSTGAIIALGLVYGKCQSMPLSMYLELQQALYSTYLGGSFT